MGRKKVKDKVIPVQVYIKKSKVVELGGMKKVRESILNFLIGDEQ